MRIFPSVFSVVSSAFAYQVTYPGGSQGWNTTGPNYLEWERVDTDPLNFTVVLTNVVSLCVFAFFRTFWTRPKNRTPPMTRFSPPSSTERLVALCALHLVEGGLRALVFALTLLKIPHSSTVYLPSLASSTSLQFLLQRLLRHFSEHLSCITIAFPLYKFLCRTATSTVTTTTPFISSSDTSTTPTGISAASLGSDTQLGWLGALGALTALVATLF